MTPRLLAAVLAALCLSFPALAAEQLVRNGSFEKGFDGWTRWGQNASLITLETGSARSGTNCARIQKGHNALYFTHPLTPGQAYELSFAYRLAGPNPSGQVALGFFKRGGGLNSAGTQKFKLLLPAGRDTNQWAEFRQVFLPTAATASCQFAFTAGDGSVLWVDDVSLRAAPRPRAGRPEQRRRAPARHTPGTAPRTHFTARTDTLLPTRAHAARRDSPAGSRYESGKSSSRRISAGENRRSPRGVDRYDPLRTGDRP